VTDGKTGENDFKANLVPDTKHLTEKQKQNLIFWTDLQETLNRGDFEGMDTFFHPEFRYSNPNRPDLGTYEQWKVSPVSVPGISSFKICHARCNR